MESKSPRPYHHHTLLPPSPSTRHSSTTSSTSSTNSNNGLLHQLPPPPPPPPYSPKPITRSESGNPYPTTFVQADTNSFKQVVQMLTGSSETAKQVSKETLTHHSTKPPHSTNHHIPPIKTIPKKQQQQQSGFKLYERRSNLKNFKLNPLLPVFSASSNISSPRKPEVLSPSILDFPALVLSPVTPLIPDPFDRSTPANNGNGVGPSLNAEDAEEKAIKEKRFYFHPSPTTTPRDAEPRLLPLFPTTSPRASSGSSQSS